MTDLLSHGAERSGTRAERHTPSARSVSDAIFVSAIVVAVPLIFVRGKHSFFLDDWDFLADRSLTSADDLFLPHNEHWSTLPIIVYRVLWSLVGLRYWPYQLVLIVLHLSAAFLLRKIMLRSGIDVWIATVAAVLFVFLGSGRDDIVSAFQIGFVGSLVCGLAHLIFADHDGASDRRDAIGLAFGVLGLLCSGVAVTMTFIVGLAVLIRRGLRPALLHTLPLAAIYSIWFAVIGHEGYTSHHPTRGELRAFVQTAISNAFSRMGNSGASARYSRLSSSWVSHWRGYRSRIRSCARAAAPVALLAGALIFALITGYGRSDSVFGSDAKASRDVYLIVAMILPAVAFALDEMARRWRFLYPLALLLLLIGIPGNIAAISPHGSDRLTTGNAEAVQALADSPYARRVPASLVVIDAAWPAESVTVGWLVNGVKSGHIPKPSKNTPQLAATATLTLVLDSIKAPSHTRACKTLTKPIIVTAATGDIYVFRDFSVAVHTPLPNGTLSAPRTFPRNSAAVVQGGPVTLAFTHNRGASPMLCRG